MLHLLIPYTLLALNLLSTPFQSADDQETLRFFEYKIAQAVVQRNLDTLKTIYAVDFVFTHGTGQVQNKEEWLQTVRKSNFIARELDAQVKEIHGDVAITSGRLTIKARGKETIWVDYDGVYRHNNHHWQMISHRSVDASYKHQQY